MQQVQNVFAVFSDRANLIWAAVMTGAMAIWGEYSYVFYILGFFLVLNVVDFYYGRKKAIATNTLSSAVGAQGIGKKVSYWVMIGLAFGVSNILIDMGSRIGIELGFLALIGWFTLAVYILNELTSIVENMLVLGYDVPAVLVKGLAAARSAVDAAGNKIVPPSEDENKSD